MTWRIEYYTNLKGNSPVKDFIDRLPKKTRARIARTFDLLEKWGIQIGEPHVKHVGRKLWEIRVKSAQSVFRFLFTVKRNRIIILLHGFQKKTRKMPGKDLAIAIKRMREVT